MRRIASPLSSNIACIRLNRHKGSIADESHGPWTDGRQRRVSGLCCGSERLRDLLGAALRRELSRAGLSLRGGVVRHHRDHGMLTSTSVTCGVGTPRLPMLTPAVITRSGVAAGPSNHEQSSNRDAKEP
jgi:hypothetical protein